MTYPPPPNTLDIPSSIGDIPPSFLLSPPPRQYLDIPPIPSLPRLTLRFDAHGPAAIEAALSGSLAVGIERALLAGHARQQGHVAGGAGARAGLGYQVYVGGARRGTAGTQAGSTGMQAGRWGVSLRARAGHGRGRGARGVRGVGGGPKGG